MVDAVTTQVLMNNSRNYVVKFTNLSDATGESLVTKIPTTDLTSHAKLWCVDYDVKVMAIQLFWAGTPNQTLVILGGGTSGSILNASRYGGLWNNAATPTGAVLLSTIGALANSSYTLILEFRKGV